MKKQLLILAAITIMVFISCSKEKIETMETSHEEIATKKGGGGAPVNLNKGLEALFRFDGNLEEATGKLKDGVPNVFGADIYTEDRHGNPKSAINFSGRYGIDIFDIPVEMDFTVAAWVQYTPTIAPVLTTYLLKCNMVSPWILQDTTKYWGMISTPMTTGVTSPPLNGKWHHLVATYDGFEIKFYVDGSLVGNHANVAGGVYPPGTTVNYQAGYSTFPGTNIIESLWQGNMDDLRFYTRVLNAIEVQALYNF